MTRGPLPKKAIALAREIALGRGPVLGTEISRRTAVRSSHFFPVLYRCTSISGGSGPMSSPRGTSNESFSGISGGSAGCRKTPVTSREIWVSLPGMPGSISGYTMTGSRRSVGMGTGGRHIAACPRLTPFSAGSPSWIPGRAKTAIGARIGLLFPQTGRRPPAGFGLFLRRFPGCPVCVP